MWTCFVAHPLEPIYEKWATVYSSCDFSNYYVNFPKINGSFFAQHRHHATWTFRVLLPSLPMDFSPSISSSCFFVISLVLVNLFSYWVSGALLLALVFGVRRFMSASIRSILCPPNTNVQFHSPLPLPRCTSTVFCASEMITRNICLLKCLGIFHATEWFMGGRWLTPVDWTSDRILSSGKDSYSVDGSLSTCECLSSTNGCERSTLKVWLQVRE